MLQTGIYPHTRILKLLLGKLAAAGEVDVLEKLGSLFSEVRLELDVNMGTGFTDIYAATLQELTRHVMLNSRVGVAYVNSGRAAEYISKTIKSAVEAVVSPEAETPIGESTLSIGAVSYAVKKHPELLPEGM